MPRHFVAFIGVSIAIWAELLVLLVYTKALVVADVFVAFVKYISEFARKLFSFPFLWIDILFLLLIMLGSFKISIWYERKPYILDLDRTDENLQSKLALLDYLKLK